MRNNIHIATEVNRIILIAGEEAERLGNNCVMPDHLFLAILRDGNSKAYKVLEKLGAAIKDIKQDIDKANRNMETSSGNAEIPLPVSVETQNVLGAMVSLARKEDTENVDSLHLLRAIIENGQGIADKVLKNHGINLTRSLDEIMQRKQTQAPMHDDNRPARRTSQDYTEEHTASPSESIIGQFGTDLTAEAAKGNLDPVIGRNNEIDRIIQILGRRKKNNPILVGDAGVGKSAIVEGLASRIAGHKVPSVLAFKRIVSLNLASVVAGTKYRGEFEERLKTIINELSKDRNTIVFIDEIHTIVGAGNASGSMDAANMLKPALSKGEIQCIGATTAEEFRKTIEKDPALERRFQKVNVEQTDYDETLRILYGIRQKYEDFHKVIYDDSALAACIKLTDRYINGRSLPDKAIDAMDEAGAWMHLSSEKQDNKANKLYNRLSSARAEKQAAVKDGQFVKAASLFRKEKELNRQLDRYYESTSLPEEKPHVTKDDIAKIVARMSGIPIEKIAETEAEKLTSLSNRIKSRIIGQDMAVNSVVNAIKRSRSGLKNPERPIGTFIFFGPTGVGKTALAKAVAEELFGSPDSLIRMDMGEFSEKFTSSRLVGAPPGYVGYDNGGELSEKVKKHPYSVILLDEIEKAHPDIYNMLLQIMDEGRLTDSNGRNVDFRNCIIIMTSNAGSREIQGYGNGLGFAGTLEAEKGKRNAAEKAIGNIFPPEFLNRVDEQIHFHGLTKDNILKILNNELAKLKKRTKEIGYDLEISQGAKEFVAEKGYDSRFGARYLNRTIGRLIEDPLADELLSRAAQPSETSNKKITIRLARSKNEKKLEIL